MKFVMKKGFIIPIIFQYVHMFKSLKTWMTRIVDFWKGGKLKSMEYRVFREFLNKHWEFENSGGMEGW